jgi:hypothetical protein
MILCGGVQIEVAPLDESYHAIAHRDGADHVDEAAVEKSSVHDRDSLMQAAISRAIEAFHALHARETEASVVAALQPYLQGAAKGRRIPMCALLLVLQLHLL